MRYFARDMFLPLRCYAKRTDLMNPKCTCDCKIFCKKPPDGGTPAYLFIQSYESQQMRRMSGGN